MKEYRIANLLLGLILGLNVKLIVSYFNEKVKRKSHVLTDEEIDKLDDRQFIEYIDQWLEDNGVYQRKAY